MSIEGGNDKEYNEFLIQTNRINGFYFIPGFYRFDEMGLEKTTELRNRTKELAKRHNLPMYDFIEGRGFVEVDVNARPSAFN
jgi:hypothetical protein